MVIDSYFNLGLLMGAVLSLLLSMYLIFYPNNFYPNRILGSLALSWSITVFAFILQSPDFFHRYPHLYASPDVFTLLFFPLIYLYIHFYLYSDEKRGFKLIFHFLPAIIYLLVFLPYFVQSAEAKIEMFNSGFPPWFRPMQTFFNLVIIAQGIFYSIFSLRSLHRFQYFRKRRLSNYQLENLKWLRLFLIINIVLWMVGTTGAFLEIFGVIIFIDLFKVFYMGLTFLTILLSVFTIQRPHLFSENENLNQNVANRQSATLSEEEQKTNKMDYEFLANYLNAEKPYLKTDLKMQDLVEATGLSYKRISELFNNEFNKSFFDVMNEFRLQEAMRLMAEKFHIQHTLPYLAERAGFNSKTTFNRIFKKYTGQTPSDYIKTLE